MCHSGLLCFLSMLLVKDEINTLHLTMSWKFYLISESAFVIYISHLPASHPSRHLSFQRRRPNSFPAQNTVQIFSCLLCTYNLNIVLIFRITYTSTCERVFTPVRSSANPGSSTSNSASTPVSIHRCRTDIHFHNAARAVRERME